MGWELNAAQRDALVRPDGERELGREGILWATNCWQDGRSNPHISGMVFNLSSLLEISICVILHSSSIYVEVNKHPCYLSRIIYYRFPNPKKK
jgi:hypothetical protein